MGNSTHISEQVIKLREQTGLTQEDMAKKLGLSRQRWIMVEKGERDLNTEELEILADTFGISVADFFDGIPDLAKFEQMYFMFLKLVANDHGNVPKTKLAKLLYLADFTSFFEQLEAMSSVKYRCLEYGPVPDVFFSMTDVFFESGKIGIELLDGGAQMISVKTRETADNLLSEAEKSTIQKIATAWKDKPTQEIVNFTHEQLPWKMCRKGEYIPYSLILQEDPNHVYEPSA
jgi:transcriptional regulator with XRE-family HTH domain